MRKIKLKPKARTVHVPATHKDVRVTRKARSSVGRSLVKTLIYRAISTVYTMGLAWAMFGSLTAAGAFGIVDLVLNSIIYFGYERAWAWIDIRDAK